MLGHENRAASLRRLSKAMDDGARARERKRSEARESRLGLKKRGFPRSVGGGGFRDTNLRFYGSGCQVLGECGSRCFTFIGNKFESVWPKTTSTLRTLPNGGLIALVRVTRRLFHTRLGHTTPLVVMVMLMLSK